MPTDLDFAVIERAAAGKSCEKCPDGTSPHSAVYVVRFGNGAPPVHTCRRQLDDAVDEAIPPSSRGGQ